VLNIYPAIDLKAGQCVRLLRGRMEDATVYSDDPASQAAAFQKSGFSWLHIVDLDGAFAGRSQNAGAVEAILAQTPLRTQLGGGVRDMAAVETWLDRGVGRVILGTAAVNDPDFVRAAAKAFPQRIVVSIDARGGLVKTEGWAGHTAHRPEDIAKRFEDRGVAAIVYTDIARDGALGGVNVEATAILAEALSIPVIASGGVASIRDIEALAQASAKIEGLIIGRALYDGRIDPQAALTAAQTERKARV
jgi:phosphoribosylformimino-5-aminoimidazole carboxamide ribotide isomerase